MMHVNVTVLCVIELELLPIKVLHCGNTDFQRFCSCDLDLDSMTFIHNKYSLDMYRMNENKPRTSMLSSYRLTYIHVHTYRRFPAKCIAQ